MNNNQPMLRMQQLIARLTEASRAYYQEDRELISNLEYDALYDELERLETETGTRLSNSPTQKVGYEVIGALRKVPHDTPMLSLDKTKEISKLASFLENRSGVLSWKLDGLTVVLTYADGRLVQAVTRGNGVIGEDVTHNARVFANLPLSIAYAGELTVRGEAVISYADFERINENISDPDQKYKNPRNLCSGTVRQLNNEVAAGRRVRFYAFDIVGRPSGEAAFPFRYEQLSWLEAQGFTVVEHQRVDAGIVADAVDDFRHRAGQQQIASDGLVLIYDDIAYGESLGVTSKFPKDAIAFKWADEQCETKLLRVEWNTSRTGLINPVAVFEPVEIEGTMVNRASLHNVSILRALELGAGDSLLVYKANMIIPQVAENRTRSNTVPIPVQCPVCHSATEIVSLREGEALYCLNPNCKAQLVSGLAHFTGRDAMNIEGLSEQTLEKFTENGLISDYTDLFSLTRYEEAILALEGFGRKSYDKLIVSVEKAKDVLLPNFIYALGIKHVGLSNAKLLCANYGHDIEKIIAAASGGDYRDDLLSVKGFGEVIANSLHVYFSDAANLALLRKALAVLRIQKPADEPAEKPLDKLTFVITGDTRIFENRKALQAFIEKHGGRATGTVTAKTSFLINNDAASVSGKNKKAAELGVPVITEAMFLEKFDLRKAE